MWLLKLDADLAEYLKKELSILLKAGEFRDALPGSVFDRQQAVARAETVYKRVKGLAGLL
jgi:hypothetical protein